VSTKLFGAENFVESKKWSAALVFLCQLAGQPKDKMLYYFVQSW
jgi:hypothetical protein